MASDALTSLAKRADDLSGTLRDAQQHAAPPGRDSAVFRQLATQLQALQQRGEDPLLRHLTIEPTALTGTPGQIPALLSTRLDAEHDEQMAAARSAMLERGAPTARLCVATHNQAVDEARSHFTARREELEEDEAPAARKRAREPDTGRAAALIAELCT